MQRSQYLTSILITVKVSMLFMGNSPADPVINEVMSLNVSTVADEDGDYSDWIEVMNHGSDALPMANWALTDDKDNSVAWLFPSLILQPGQILVVFASGKNRSQWPGELHTDFRISSSGEEIVLINPDSNISDLSPSQELGPDESLVRIPDGTGEWYRSWNPTPGEENGAESPQQKAEAPRLSLPSGFYDQGTVITISTTGEDADIYYSLDGSVPTDSSTLYEEPLVCIENTVIRAITIRTGLLPSEPACGTYLIGYFSDLPVISILTHPDNLWSDECGIYVEGPNAESEEPHLGANYWQNWEIPVHLEYIGTAGTVEYAVDAGMSIHGGWTRMLPQKSLRITARDEYGSDRFDYRFFPDNPLTEYKSLILRNSGNDWQSTMIRDALMTGLTDPLSIAIQAYRPVTVFLNGEYWGIHNLRERVSEEYLSTHYGVSPDHVDIVEGHRRVTAGDMEAYEALTLFADSHDLSEPVYFDSISGMMDIEDFIRYQAAEIFFANKDWPANNIKCWRERSDCGRFRWIMYDTDNGFCLFGLVDHNTLEYATAENSDHWANPPYATLLLRKLLENQTFRHRFITRMCDLMNIVFQPSTVLEQIDVLSDDILTEMPVHEERWYPNHDWIGNLEVLRDFAVRRSLYVFDHMSDKFDLEDPVTITVHREGGPAGIVIINGFPVETYPIHCRHYPGLPVSLEAQPYIGYRFTGWEGDIDTCDPILTLIPGSNVDITARFEYDFDASPVVITEVNYHAPSSCDPGDWVELISLFGDHYLSGWSLKDSDDSHEYIIDSGILLREGQYVVIAEDEAAFRSIFPDVDPVIGELGFGLSGEGDCVRLYDEDENLIDYLAYDDSLPWPTQADGYGFTLQVINPALPNDYVTNWQASPTYLGDPCSGSYPALESHEATNRSIEFALHGIVPNPLVDHAECLLTIPRTSWLTLSVYDTSGRRVRILHDAYLGKGTHSLPIATQGIASGSYIIHAQVPGRWSASSSLIVRR